MRWQAAVRTSGLLAQPPVLHLHDDRLLYLDRYWREEKQVREDLLALLAPRPAPEMAAIGRLFPAGYDEQRGAAEIALSQSVTVLTGGPGTGKTTTLARLLALIAAQAGWRKPRRASWRATVWSRWRNCRPAIWCGHRNPNPTPISRGISSRTAEPRKQV